MTVLAYNKNTIVVHDVSGVIEKKHCIPRHAIVNIYSTETECVVCTVKELYSFSSGVHDNLIKWLEGE